MDVKDIVNRFELLYPNNSALTDLRKLLNHGDEFSLYRLMGILTNSHLVKSLKTLAIEEIKFDESCLSQGQINSKQWVVAELSKLNLDLGTVFICAGWYATLSSMLFESEIKISKIRSFDIDPTCIRVAEIFNKPWVVDNWKFKSSTKDIFELNFNADTYYVTRADGTMCELTDVPDTIINTSCEHITEFDKWYALIPKGKLVVLQTNNYFDIPEHVNCSTSLQDFANRTPMTVLFQGELMLEKYTRYMRIGYV
jgi:hypothetical protein